MKKLAKQGQNDSVKYLAKDIVRMKQSETKFLNLKKSIKIIKYDNGYYGCFNSNDKCYEKCFKMYDNGIKSNKITRITKIITKISNRTRKNGYETK